MKPTADDVVRLVVEYCAEYGRTEGMYAGVGKVEIDGLLNTLIAWVGVSKEQAFAWSEAKHAELGT